jgi:hypothetical protein
LELVNEEIWKKKLKRMNMNFFQEVQEWMLPDLVLICVIFFLN